MSKYRYILIRTINACNPKKILFVGVNPSTADVNTDDPTTRKLIEFTRRWGYGKYLLMNAFPYRATDIKDLAEYQNNQYRHNRTEIQDAAHKVDLIVPMWGRISKIPKHLLPEVQVIEDILIASRKPIEVFDWTKDGEPKHPLMLPYSIVPQSFFE